jgi:hypothetical protein
MCPDSPPGDCDDVLAETSPFQRHERSKGHDKHEHGQRIRDSTGVEPPCSSRGRCGSPSAAVLVCGAAGTALGSPNDLRLRMLRWIRSDEIKGIRSQPRGRNMNIMLKADSVY